MHFGFTKYKLTLKGLYQPCLYNTYSWSTQIPEKKTPKKTRQKLKKPKQTKIQKENTIIFKVVEKSESAENYISQSNPVIQWQVYLN